MLDRTDHNHLAMLANSRERIGGNNPPGAINYAQETMTAIALFLKDHPVIQTDADARAAKLIKDRGDAAVKEMEDERDALVRPLNEQVATINGRYRPVRDPLKKVIDDVKARLTAFIRTEERKRQEIADAARKAREELERAAREAEEREREARENASLGELDVDVVGATVDADAAFAEFERADRQAARAERDAHVKIGGGFARSVSLRQRETLTITDIAEAIAAVGVTDKIRDAVLSAARDFRKAFGELPDGVAAEYEQSV